VPNIVADRDCCMGSGMCTVYAPATFTQDAHAKVVVVDPPADSADAIKAAVEACPTGALQIVEARAE
jgi:ferredoxin